jgi:hypothetical protein
MSAPAFSLSSVGPGDCDGTVSGEAASPIVAAPGGAGAGTYAILRWKYSIPASSGTEHCASSVLVLRTLEGGRSDTGTRPVCHRLAPLPRLRMDQRWQEQEYQPIIVWDGKGADLEHSRGKGKGVSGANRIQH